MAVVYANQGWQDSGAEINPGVNLVLNYLSGTWTSNPTAPGGPAMYGPAGNPNYIAHQYGYVLQGAAEGCLCGKVVNEASGAQNGPFYVGNSANIPNSVTGRLYLVINDDIDSQWGNGLADNSGFIVMQISSAAGSPAEVLGKARETQQKASA
jgi:hypothetical protein